MKKLYIVFLLAIATSFSLMAQEMAQGGNMEDESAWTVTQNVTDAALEATVTFNYTDDIPAAGEGGAMRIECSNTENNGTNVTIWQEVELLAGHSYVVDAAFKDLGGLLVESYWCQWYVLPNDVLPTDGSDYSAETEAVLQINTWGGCDLDADELTNDYEFMDITLQTWDCENAANSDTVAIDADGTYVFAIKTGIWNAAAISYDVVIDNMSLYDLDELNSVADFSIEHINIYPNPANDVLNINAEFNISNITVMNVLGQSVISVENADNSLDVSSLEQGIYIIRIEDFNNNVYTAKFRKN